MKEILNKYSAVFLAGAFFAIAAGTSIAEPAAADSTAITSTVNAFHKALAASEPERVIALLSPDALIVEAGIVQTRDEYKREHLAADIAFARAVPGAQRDIIVRQEGDVGWMTSTFRVTGTFHKKPVNDIAAETVVLTKTSAGWRISTIHWSSHKVPAN